MAIAVPRKAQKAGRPSVQSKGWPYDHPLLGGMHTALFFKRLRAGCTAPWAAAFRLSGEKAVPAATATGYPLGVPAQTFLYVYLSLGSLVLSSQIQMVSKFQAKPILQFPEFFHQFSLL